MLFRKPDLPIQLDKLAVACNTASVQAGFYDKATRRSVWLIAKPMELVSWHLLLRRVYHAWLVLCGRAKAYQYAEDSLASGAECIHPYGVYKEMLVLDEAFTPPDYVTPSIKDGFRYCDEDGRLWQYNGVLHAWSRVVLGWDLVSDPYNHTDV